MRRQVAADRLPPWWPASCWRGVPSPARRAASCAHEVTCLGKSGGGLAPWSIQNAVAAMQVVAQIEAFFIDPLKGVLALFLVELRASAAPGRPLAAHLPARCWWWAKAWAHRPLLSSWPALRASRPVALQGRPRASAFAAGVHWPLNERATPAAPTIPMPSAAGRPGWSITAVGPPAVHLPVQSGDRDPAYIEFAAARLRLRATGQGDPAHRRVVGAKTWAQDGERGAESGLRRGARLAKFRRRARGSTLGGLRAPASWPSAAALRSPLAIGRPCAWVHGKH